jgi:endonuclease/exonuclease/phosphatase (EEP) superfamily protein YafD
MRTNSRMKFLLGLLLLISPKGYSQIHTTEFEVPPAEQVIREIQRISVSELPQRFNMLVWNIHKATAGDLWLNDFLALARQNELILLQEGHTVPVVKQAFGMLSTYAWTFYTSFFFKGEATGVVIGGAAQPFRLEFLKTPNNEPVIKTPKVTGIGLYHVAGFSESLLVLNIHGINFVNNMAFENQIVQNLERVKTHTGPVIYAGDFNTWNAARQNFLVTKAKEVGLEASVLSINGVPKPILDHILTRGITVEAGRTREDITSSDHKPLEVTLKINGSER